MKVLDWREREVVVREGAIAKIEQWSSDSIHSWCGYSSTPIYGVSTDNGYLYFITKTEIEELYKVMGG